MLRSQLAIAQLVQADATNQLRQLHLQYAVGDKVYVSTRNFNTVRLSKKLDDKYARLYLVTKVLSVVTYRLDLPTTMNVYNAFYASLLLLADTIELLLGQVVELPALVKIASDNEQVVKKILAIRLCRNKRQYKVRQVSYNDDIQEFEDNVAGTTVLDAFIKERAANAALDTTTAAKVELSLSATNVIPAIPAKSSAAKAYKSLAISIAATTTAATIANA